MKYTILIFESIHNVLKAERIFEANHVTHEIIPMPKEISSDCGMAIRINSLVTNIERITDMLKKDKMDYQTFEKETE